MEYLCCSEQSALLDDDDFLMKKLRKHPNVPGVVVAELHNESPLETKVMCAGFATTPPLGQLQHGREMTELTSLQVGNLSKTVAAAFALETRVAAWNSTLRRHFTLREFERRSGRWGSSDLGELDEG